MASENNDESLLIERVKKRDADALMALYRTHGRRIFSFTYRMLQDRGAAEEAVQDTFWKLWQRPELFDPGRGVLIAWLYTVSRNIALDRKRKENRRGSENVINSMDGQVKGGMVPEMAVLDNPILANSIRETMETLPPDQKDAIELAYFEGLTQAEIAKQLGAPLGTVKTRLRLGLSKLREVFRESGKVKS